MPPRLALLIGLGFVYLAFRAESRRGALPHPGLIWPTLWYMTGASHMFGEWCYIWGVPLPGSSGNAADGSIVDASFYMVLTIIGTYLLYRRRFDLGGLLRSNPRVTTLFAFMALSILWSAYPFVSFKRYIKVLGSVVMAMLVLTDEHPMDATFTILRRCLYVHLPMSIVCIKYFREIGIAYDWDGTSHMWNGISTSKNTLGQVAMLGVLYFYWEIRRNWRARSWRQFNIIYLVMAIFLLKGAEGAISMTSLSVCGLAMFVFIRLQALRSRPDVARRFVLRFFALTVALVTLVLVHSVVMFSENSLFGQIITKLGRNITLTDRTYIWSDVYAAAAKHPLIGVGFGGFWIGREANIPWAGKLTWILAQAHNGYVDTYLQIGWIGGILLAIVLFSTVPRLLAAMEEDFDFGCFRIALLITIIFVNITESTYLRGDHHLWFIMQLVIWQVPRRWQAPVGDGLAAEAETDPTAAVEAEATPVSTYGEQSADPTWV